MDWQNLLNRPTFMTMFMGLMWQMLKLISGRQNLQHFFGQVKEIVVRKIDTESQILHHYMDLLQSEEFHRNKDLWAHQVLKLVY